MPGDTSALLVRDGSSWFDVFETPKDARWADGELIVFSGQLELAFCFL